MQIHSIINTINILHPFFSKKKIDCTLGTPRQTIRALSDWCWRHCPNIVFLSETMLTVSALEGVMRKCGFVKGICLESKDNSRGIGFWWNDVIISSVSYFRHHFFAHVMDREDNLIWAAVGVYGWPNQANKYQTWTL